MGKWEMVKLGDVCEIVSGSTPSTRNLDYWDGDIKWVTPAEITESDYYIYDTERHITEKAGLKPMPIGTVLLSSRAPIGKVAIADAEMCCNQGFKNLICSKRINNRYLFRYLRSKTEQLNDLGRGATFKEISKSIVENVTIPLPQPDVQRKIADVLDRAAALVEKRKAQIEKLDLLVKSRFVEMFGDPVTNPRGWEIKLLGELGNLKNGMNYSRSDSGYKIHCLGVGNFGDLYEIHGVDAYSEINLSAKPTNDYLLRNGDIVFVRSNGNRELVGRAVEVFPGDRELTFGGFCIRYRSATYNLATVYLNHLLHLPAMRKTLLKDGRGANIQNVNQQMLSALKIPVPPFDAQNHFIDFVCQVDKVKLEVKQSLKELERNYNSLMQKCFRGEIF